MTQKTPTVLYKDTYLTEKDVLALYAKGGFEGLRDKDAILSYVAKVILDKDRVSFFKKQLKNGLSVNYKFQGVFYNLISSAVLCKAPKIMEELIRQGADLNAGLALPNGHTRTPLHVAVQVGEVELVAQLLKAGVPVNSGNQDCMFHLAKHNSAMLLYLLQHTEGPTLHSFQNAELSHTFTYWLASHGKTDIFSAMFENIMRKPKEEARQIFEVIKEQLVALDTFYKPGDPSIRPLSSFRKEEAHKLYQKYYTLFEKQLLESEISTTTLSSDVSKIHKI